MSPLDTLAFIALLGASAYLARSLLLQGLEILALFRDKHPGNRPIRFVGLAVSGLLGGAGFGLWLVVALAAARALGGGA